MGKKEKKDLRKFNKNDLPVFDSDHDFLKEFEKPEKIKSDKKKPDKKKIQKESQPNKHGVKVLDLSEDKNFTENRLDFAELLEESFKKGKEKSVKKTSSMPVKKRIKRYPPVEVELDLHGYNAIGAQIKVRSFIHSRKHQGFFTIRIIVGKGLHSDLGPVLPDVVEQVLQEMKKQNLVIWYEWDKKKKSKSGAVIVYLKQFERFE
ncbi:MAG: Smr/MutS family protein [Desulfobacula sp.]|uniref:Smr/MutS family protein n=1 Tax=Desulfobacula sp. TaxID=2593537 RepID=UPI0025C1CCCD|nr:Smr/MutS family protein [Desulfobacula sp.]MCD4719042.1 Smr/MutS family protein [Desulfobacula sp.]